LSIQGGGDFPKKSQQHDLTFYKIVELTEELSRKFCQHRREMSRWFNFIKSPGDLAFNDLINELNHDSKHLLQLTVSLGDHGIFCAKITILFLKKSLSIACNRAHY
jgi:hypothetical protein